jgi:hypothetical protein
VPTERTKMTTININPDVIRGRRELIQQDAPCVGCGTRLADCLDQQDKNSTAPDGCCAMSTGMTGCSHQADFAAQAQLLNEIEKGEVRTATAVSSEREAKREERAAQLVAATTPDGRVLDLAAKFQQGVWWRTKEGEWLRIAEMGERHRRHTAAMLLRKAAGYVGMMAWSDLAGLTGPFGDAPEEVVDATFHEQAIREQDPEAWVRGTPLYRALLDGIEPA